jgi:hypothetical protein
VESVSFFVPLHPIWNYSKVKDKKKNQKEESKRRIKKKNQKEEL